MNLELQNLIPIYETSGRENCLLIAKSDYELLDEKNINCIRINPLSNIIYPISNLETQLKFVDYREVKIEDIDFWYAKIETFFKIEDIENKIIKILNPNE